MDIVWVLLIGLAAGWLAGQFTKGSGFGLLGNLIVGILGALVGGFLLPLIGFKATTLLALLLQSTAGAIVLLIALSFAFRKRRKA